MTEIHVCFDTSAVCRLFDTDARLKTEIEAVTKLLRLIDEREQWLVVVSPVFMVELADAPEDKQQQMVEALFTYSISDLPYNQDAASLTRAYVSGGVLTPLHWHDLEHIAYASLYQCRFLVSCDTTNIAKPRTQSRVTKVNKALGHSTPQIITPLKLLEKLQ